MNIKASLSSPPSDKECESMEGIQEKDAMCEYVKANPGLLNDGKSELQGNIFHDSVFSQVKIKAFGNSLYQPALAPRTAHTTKT